MSIAAQTLPMSSPASLAWRDLYRFTVEEYERMSGVLEDSQVELINGLVVKKMGKKPPHIRSVKRSLKVLMSILPAGWTWRKEDPVRIPDFDEPEPDVAIVRGSDEDYDDRIPEPADVGVLVEVAEITLERDRGEKLVAYGRSGIPVYWIVNLVDCQVEVYTDPGREGYRSRLILKPGEQVALILDGSEVGRIAVEDLLRVRRS
jgi:Uma2 family endonuclease